MYNFDELQTKSAEIVQRSQDSDYLALIATWLNTSLLTLYNEYDYWAELKAVHNFTTVDGTSLYYMPADFEKPLRWYDITNDKKITIETEEKYFDANIANIADGNEADAQFAYLKEVVGVKRQVVSTGATTKAKSSATESANVTVRVKGYVDSDLTIIGFENITVSGTSYAAGSTTFYKILAVSKDSTSSGYITLADSSGNVLSIIGQNERVVRHKAYKLGLIPDDSTTNHRVLYKRKFDILVNAYDYPFVEADDYLIYSAVAMAIQQEKEELERAALFMQQANRAKAAILLNQVTQLGPDYQHKAISPLMAAHRS